MSSISSTALSGMNAARVSLQATSHNIANLGTDGFRRQWVSRETMPSSGVSTSLSQSGAAGPALEADLVGLLQARHDFLANLAVFRTGNQLIGSLLDTSA